MGAVVDLSFLTLLFAVVVREILAGRNWRNLPVCIALAALLAANCLMHLEANGLVSAGFAGERSGVAILTLLIALIGGRVIPSFTRNWLVKRAGEILPIPFNRFDVLTLMLTLIALGFWVVSPASVADKAFPNGVRQKL